jgi:hypothetical protein
MLTQGLTIAAENGFFYRPLYSPSHKLVIYDPRDTS